MRILINSINFSPELTSTGKYTGEMARWLADRNHEIRVVTSPPHYPGWQLFAGYSCFRFTREKLDVASESNGTLEIFRCPTWIPQKPRGWRRLLYLASFSLSSCAVILAQAAWKPDVVLLIEPTLSCAPQTLLAAWLAGAPAWLHIQDFEVDAAFQLTDSFLPSIRPVADRVDRWLTSKFARVSTISTRMLQRLPEKGIDPLKTVLFQNWVCTAEIYPLPGPSPLRKQFGIASKTTVALFSGSIVLKQGLHLVVEAARILASRRDIKFVICGDGPYRDELIAMAGPAQNILFLPLQPAATMNDLLNLADIHLLPQLGGAADLVMPSKLTGMLASGRAVVATADAGTQIATILSEKGIFTAPGDAHAFAAAVAHLADNPELRRSMGEIARAYAVTHLNRDKILSQFEGAIYQVCHPVTLGREKGVGGLVTPVDR